MTIPVTHTLTISPSIDSSGRPMVLILLKSDPDVDAKAVLQEWLGVVSRGGAGVSIIDTTASATDKALADQLHDAMRTRADRPELVIDSALADAEPLSEAP